MSLKLRKTLICLLLILAIGVINVSPAFASDIYYVGTWYETGTFSFTDYTLTSVKTVMGRYITVTISFYKPYWDAGLGDIKLKFEIRDAYTNQAITGQYVVGTTGSTVVTQTYYDIDLGYSGRQVRFWFDASSAGQSNGNFRSATVSAFGLYTHN